MRKQTKYMLLLVLLICGVFVGCVDKETIETGSSPISNNVLENDSFKVDIENVSVTNKLNDETIPLIRDLTFSYTKPSLYLLIDDAFYFINQEVGEGFALYSVNLHTGLASTKYSEKQYDRGFSYCDEIEQNPTSLYEFNLIHKNVISSFAITGNLFVYKVDQTLYSVDLKQKKKTVVSEKCLSFNGIEGGTILYSEY